MASNVLPVSIIKQRMNQDAANYLLGNEPVSIDMLLVTAATPAIHADFKNAKPEELNGILKQIQKFLKSHMRFLNFDKEAAMKGLSEEWLDSIDETDKMLLVSNLAVIERITEEGEIIPKKKLCETFASIVNFEPVKYGNETYAVKKKTSNRSASLSKEKIISAVPDQKLAEKLLPYINWYKKWWGFVSRREDYKWTATKQFQSKFDIKQDDLATNLKEALSEEQNLVSGPMNFSKSMLLKNARLEDSKEDVRSALSMLFDETIDLAIRANDFLEQFGSIHERNKKKHPDKFKANENHKQDVHAISVYLAFRYPAKHYIYKETVWYNFVNETGIEYPSLYRFTHKLVGYEQICDQIREILMTDKELLSLNDSTYKNDPSNYHLLTQDFMYAISEYFVGLDKDPVA